MRSASTLHRVRATKRPWWSRCNKFADWLKELDMSEYTQRFAENDIDLVVVPDLTAQHLKDLGVSLENGLNLKKGPAKRGAEPRAAACVGDALRSAANHQHFGSTASFATPT